MTWFLPAILAALFWGVGQTFIKKGLTDVTPFVSNLLIAAFTFLWYVPYALINGVHWASFPMVLLFGFLANLPNFIFPYIIEKTEVSLAGTVLATYPIYTVILSLLFLGERLTPFQAVGIFVVISGMFFVAKPQKEKFYISSWLIWTIIGSVVIGLGDFIGKVTLTRFDLSSFLLALAIGAIPSLLLFRIFDRSPIRFPKWSPNFRASIIGNLIMPVGLLALYIAFSKGPASLASPVASTYPAITVLLAYLWLKEKINKNQLVGIIMVTLGVILLG